MKRSASLPLIVLVCLAALLCLAGLASASGARGAQPAAPMAGAPSVVSYQGQVTVSGIPYTGTAYFKFAIVDLAGTTSYWSNDGTSTDGGEPNKAVTLTVRSGFFSILLGDTALDNMLELPASAFAGTDRWLRAWFSSDNSTFVQLAPDRRIAAAPYALQAEEAKSAATAGDADLLDGQDASAFAASGHTHAALAAGAGLSGGSYDGGAAVTLNVGGGSGITANADNLALGPLTANWSQTGAYDVVLGNAASELQILESAGATYYGAFDVGDLSANETYTFGTGGTVWTAGNDGNGSTLDADLLDGLHASAFRQQQYANVVVVAQSGGDFTAVQAALDSITGASDTNRYLVWVAPGVYTETVTMKQYVDIEGAGELLTTVSFTGSGSASTGAVVGASNAELRFLTVRNTGGGLYAIAIYNPVSSRLAHVTATASGGTYNYGVYNSSPTSSAPTMTNVTASASGGTNSYGVYNSASPTMTNVTASASGGTANNYGVYNASFSPTMTSVTASASGGTTSYGVYNNFSSPTMMNVTASASGGTTSNYGVFSFLSSSPTMTNVTASASGGTASYGVYNSATSPTMTSVTATASGGTNNYGVYNSSSYAPAMNNVTATASGGTTSYGVYSASSSPTIQNSTIRANGGASSYGIYNEATSGSYTVKVNNCQVTGSTNTVANSSFFTVRIGASQLDGGAVTGGGTVTCIGVYDENYASPGYTTCP